MHPKQPLKILISFLLPATLALACSGSSKAPSSPPSIIATSQPESKLARAKSSPGAKVFFVDLKDGDTLTNPVTLKFGVEGIELAPAGEVKDNSGHHHLLIDIDPLPPMDAPLPSTQRIQHFGKAQNETTQEIPPGPHTLQLLFAGGNHVPHDPPVMSSKINITVK